MATRRKYREPMSREDIVLRDTITQLKKGAEGLDDEQYMELLRNIVEYCKASLQLTKLGKRPQS